ncbi:Protein of unknown function, partial [Gryllus bimaculatus]
MVPRSCSETRQPGLSRGARVGVGRGSQPASAQRCSSRRTGAVAARSTGRAPLASRAVRLAPATSSARTMCTSPSSAAMCSGVLRIWSAAVADAPLRSSTLKHATLRDAAAKCVAVSP